MVCLKKWDHCVWSGVSRRRAGYIMSFYNLTTKQPNQEKEKGKDLTFLQRRHTHDQQHLRRCSASLIIREMQIKTTVRYHLPPIRMATVQKKKEDKCGRNVKKLEPWCTVGRNVKWCSHEEKRMMVLRKIRNRMTTFGYLSQRIESRVSKRYL